MDAKSITKLDACLQCGKETPHVAEYCPNCGAKVKFQFRTHKEIADKLQYLKDLITHSAPPASEEGLANALKKMMIFISMDAMADWIQGKDNDELIDKMLGKDL